MNNQHDTKAEQALLGYVIANQSAFAEAKPIIASLGYFTSPAHRAIYAALLDMEGDAWDGVTIGHHLKKIGKLEMTGGYTYLAELEEVSPGKMNVVYYAKLLRDSYCVRKTICFADELKVKMAGCEEPLSEIVSGHIQKLQSLQSSLGAEKNNIRTVAEIAPEVFREIENAYKTGEHPALSTTFSGLDDYLGGGLYRGDCNILAASSSIGKTALALNMAVNHSPDLRILLISLEATGPVLTRDRLLPLNSGVPSTNIRQPDMLDSDQWDRLTMATEIVCGYDRFKICDKPTMTMTEIEAVVDAEMNSEDGMFDFLIIDHFHEISLDRKFERADLGLKNIIQRIRALIKKHNLFSLTLCQLNRSPGKEKREPEKHDLRGSGGLEETADDIIFLHKPDPDDDLIIAKIAKNRNGPVGKTELYFNKKLTRFSDGEPERRF